MRPLLLTILTIAAGWALAESNFPYLGTDVSKTRIALDQILSAGPPPQGIPALGFPGYRGGQIPATNPPQFAPASQAGWLSAQEPVLVYGNRAYPLRILRWHEIVNDGPVVVTYSPLCNSAVVYDRRLGLSEAERQAVLKLNPAAPLAQPDAAFTAGHAAQTGESAPPWVLQASFGTSGMLYNANPLMFDAVSGSVFSQLTGEGAVGLLSGARLLRLPAQVMGFAEFAKAFPNGQVLALPTGPSRPYAQNPYLGYDSSDEQPILYLSPADNRLPAKERVVGLTLGRLAVAYPLSLLTQRRVVNDQVGGAGVVVWWAPGTRSALDASDFARARDVGAVGVFSRSLEGRTLSFRAQGDVWLDLETGSRWNLLGQATDGPLRGRRLQPIPHDTPFWFAWSAFRPDTQVQP